MAQNLQNLRKMDKLGGVFARSDRINYGYKQATSGFLTLREMKSRAPYPSWRIGAYYHVVKTL